MLRAIGVIALLAVSGPAQAETWCLGDFDNRQRTCVFPSMNDCVRAALIGGGRCERQRTATKRPVPENAPTLPGGQRTLVR